MHCINLFVQIFANLDCYGVVANVDRNNWKCDRCIEDNYHAVCCLCPLRGGPLKITACNQWAHVTCSLILPEVKFENENQLKPVDISEVKSFRKNFQMV